MARPTQYYVDPSLGSDTGDGSVGTPWGRLSGSVVQYALDTGITRDATNGDQINVKAGSSDVLGAAITLTTYGSPSSSAPIIFRGYTTTADDGGIGAIDGAATYSIYSSTLWDYVKFVDMRLTNSGTASLLVFDNDCSLINCQIDGSSNATAITAGTAFVMINCYVHTITGATALFADGEDVILGNFFDVDVTSVAMNIGAFSFIAHNVIHLGTTNGTDGIEVTDNHRIYNNSVFATAGTGYGIGSTSGAVDEASIFNNIVEGFSGAGGVGYAMGAASNIVGHGYNAAYNNTDDTEFDASDYHAFLGGNDIPLDASAFTAPGSLDFSVGTEVKATGVPNFVGGGIAALTEQFIDMGAAQREEAGGGGGVKMAGAGGAMVG